MTKEKEEASALAAAEADAIHRRRKGLAVCTVDQIQHSSTPRPTTITSTADGRDHLISAQAMTSGLVAGHEDYLAICGRVVVAAPMVIPPGQTCFDCETARHRTTTTVARRRPRRGVVVVRCRRRRSAHVLRG